MKDVLHTFSHLPSKCLSFYTHLQITSFIAYDIFYNIGKLTRKIQMNILKFIKEIKESNIFCITRPIDFQNNIALDTIFLIIHRISSLQHHRLDEILFTYSLLSEFLGLDLHLVSNIWQGYDKVLCGSRYDTCPALRPVNDVIYDPRPFKRNPEQTFRRRDVSCEVKLLSVK